MADTLADRGAEPGPARGAGPAGGGGGPRAGGGGAPAPSPYGRGGGFTGRDGAVLAACGALFLLAYLLARRRLGPERAGRRSWVLTGVNSAVTAALACPGAWGVVGSGWDVAVVEGGGPASRLAVTVFLAYLLCDAAVGAVDYRQKVSFWLGWVHHAAYTVLCLHLMHANRTNAMSMFLLEEVPTAILALGRTGLMEGGDAAFGVSFVALRVLFHCYATRQLYVLRGHATLGNYWLASLAAFALNIHWLWAWGRSVARRRAGKAGGDGGGATTTGAETRERRRLRELRRLRMLGPVDALGRRLVKARRLLLAGLLRLSPERFGRRVGATAARLRQELRELKALAHQGLDDLRAQSSNRVREVREAQRQVRQRAQQRAQQARDAAERHLRGAGRRVRQAGRRAFPPRGKRGPGPAEGRATAKKKMS